MGPARRRPPWTGAAHPVKEETVASAYREFTRGGQRAPDRQLQP
jgi:hypothetical protein